MLVEIGWLVVPCIAIRVVINRKPKHHLLRHHCIHTGELLLCQFLLLRLSIYNYENFFYHWRWAALRWDGK
jgi:hypothetical protein